MAIADARHLNEALIVAAGRKGAAVQRDLGHHRVAVAGIADTDPPWLAVGLRADHADVAAKIDEAVPRLHLVADFRRAIGRIFLAEPAEVELHAGLRK